MVFLVNKSSSGFRIVEPKSRFLGTFNTFFLSLFLSVFFLLHLLLSNLTQAIHERHENALLKGEMEKLREENQAMREMISKSSCTKGCCSASTNSLDAIFTTSDQQQQQLVTEIARLKAEVNYTYINCFSFFFFLFFFVFALTSY